MRELSEVVEGVDDKWVWSLDTSGVYSVKSTCKFLVMNYQNTGDGFLCRVWNNLVPLKMTTFVWRLAQDRIPSKINVFRISILQSSMVTCEGCL